jgi:hypothetical protein
MATEEHPEQEEEKEQGRSGSTWSSFLLAVDEVPPKSAVIETVGAWLIEKGFTEPRLLEGTTESDLDSAGMPSDLVTRAFLKRTLRCVEAAQQAKRFKAANPPRESDGSLVGTGAVGASVTDPSRFVGLPDASALALAHGLASAPKRLDVSQELEKSPLAGLPFHMQVDAAIWQLLEAETTAASSCIPPRTPFSYVDLTSKEVLPLWISPESVGGKLPVPGESEWNMEAGASLQTLGHLGAALRAVTQTPRFFRSLTQWSAAFLRYAVVAVALKHMSLPAVLSYMNVIYQIAESERAAGNSPYLAILYDDLLRRDFQRRAERRDPTFDLLEAVQRIDKQILQAARTRLSSVLSAAGLQHGRNVGGASGPTGSSSSQLSAESMLAQHSATAQAIQKKAEQASRALAAQQRELESKQLAMRDATKGGDQWRSNRHRKAQAFFSAKKEQRQSGKGQSGKGKSKGQQSGGGKGNSGWGWN